MNRLIIIGNGFDLAHKLGTSYHDFILDYLKECLLLSLDNRMENYNPPYNNYYYFNDELIQIKFNENYQKNIYLQNINKIQEISEIFDILKKLGIVIEYPFEIIKIGIEKLTEFNWVDFEIEYFNELDRIKTKNHNPVKSIEDLNNQFNIFKEKLEVYLKKQQDDFTNSFERLALCDCFCEDIIDIDVDLETIASQAPKRLLFLNFNYTNTLEPYVEECQKQIHSEINYIHGSINDENNPPIFGFGDEFNKKYKEFEDEENNELFKHIKSFGYLKTNNYSNLTRFLASDKFQVQIYGHSCGLSDRTMFKEIFEHPNCLSIKLFYHKKVNNEDDYTEKTYELYRHFSDKNIMRKKIVDKQKCKAMPQPTLK